MPHIGVREDLFGITSLLDFKRETAAPICELTHLLLRGESTLTEAERELIATHVSYLNECKFCSAAHAAVVCALPGGKNEDVISVRGGVVPENLSPKLKSLLRITGIVQKSGKNVMQSDIDNARNNGATDREIHDTVLIAALFCLYNRYVDGLATIAPADPAFYTALANRIAGRGYKMPEDGYHKLVY